MRKQQHFHEHVDQRLRQCVPRPGNKYNDAASSLGRDHDQPKIREQPESRGRTGAFQMKMRLDLGLKDFQMRVHVAGRHAAQFAIDPVNVGEHHQPHTERGDGQGIEERHHR